MITADLGTVSHERLWKAYIDIDYGRTVPKKGYKGFRTFLEDITPADRVTGTARDGFTLYFDNEAQYTMFLLKWS